MIDKAILTDVCDFQGGSQPPKDEWINHEESGYVRMLQIRDFTQVNTPVEYVLENASTKTCQSDDILIARYGASIGKILTGLAGAYNVAIIKTIPNTKVLNKKYLYYYLQSDYFQSRILNVGSRAAQAGFNKEDLSKFLIPTPKIEEQFEITKKLNSINFLISLRKQQLSKLNELIKSRFIEVFGDSRNNPKGWDTVFLDSIASVGSSKRVFVEELKENGVPFYRGTEIGSLALGESIAPELFITEEHYRNLCEATGAPVIGDLLMPSICSDGRIWHVNTDKPFYFKDGRVLWLRPQDTQINSMYLLYTLKEKIITDYINIASGTTFAELKIFALKKLKIMMPPLSLQNNFATFIQQVDKSKFEIQKSLEKLEILKKALMQQYFG